MSSVDNIARVCVCVYNVYSSRRPFGAWCVMYIRVVTGANNVRVLLFDLYKRVWDIIDKVVDSLYRGHVQSIIKRISAFPYINTHTHTHTQSP